MERLVLDNGIKHYEIADSEGNVRGIISFNPSDFGFIARSNKVGKDIDEYMKSIPDNATEELFVEMDQVVRGKIDELFGSSVSEVLFGTANCLSLSGGVPIAKKALDLIVPIIAEEISKEMESGIDAINKYTEDVTD